MYWLAKVTAYRILSALPGGAVLYRFIQERVTKSLVPASERVSQKIDVGLEYFCWLANHGLRERLIEGVHLDFGAGWHPTIPLLYYCLGVKRQHLLDVAANLDGQMLGQTIKAFLTVVTNPQWPHRAKLGRGGCRPSLKTRTGGSTSPRWRFLTTHRTQIPLPRWRAAWMWSPARKCCSTFRVQ